MCVYSYKICSAFVLELGAANEALHDGQLGPMLRALVSGPLQEVWAIAISQRQQNYPSLQTSHVCLFQRVSEGKGTVWESLGLSLRAPNGRFAYKNPFGIGLVAGLYNAWRDGTVWEFLKKSFEICSGQCICLLVLMKMASVFACWF